MSVLKAVTNNCHVDKGNAERRGQRRKNGEVARQRWKMLANAILEPEKPFFEDIFSIKHSVRRFSSFGLFKTENFKKDGDWVNYSCRILDVTYQVEIRLVKQRFTPKDLVGFNNTGNICIWPSEEVLGFYLLSIVDSFEGKQILEIGGGMTCLAGLLLAKYGTGCQVDVTDGNSKSVKNVERIIEKNALDSSRISAFYLDWVDHRKITKKYDFVLSSDCLFFDETRQHLVEAIWHLLKEDGTGFVLAPKRGPTLNSFVTMAKKKGFKCIMHRNYDDTIWKKHLEFKKSKSEYDEDLHYPVLLILKKPHFQNNTYLTGSKDSCSYYYCSTYI